MRLLVRRASSSDRPPFLVAFDWACGCVNCSFWSLRRMSRRGARFRRTSYRPDRCDMFLRCCLLSISESAVVSALCLFLRYPLTPHRFRSAWGDVGCSSWLGAMSHRASRAFLSWRWRAYLGCLQKVADGPERCRRLFRTLRLSWGEGAGPLFEWFLKKPAANFPKKIEFF